MKKWNTDIAHIHVQTTPNNTITTVTTPEGKVMFGKSGGTEGFKGKRKGGFLPAQIVGRKVATQLRAFNIFKVKIISVGSGSGLVPIARVMEEKGFQIISISYNDRFPHNGCRPRKKRRV